MCLQVTYTLQISSSRVNSETDLTPDVTVDFDGDARPIGGAYEIGADERVGIVNPSVNRPGGNGRNDHRSGYVAGNGQ